jgi:hypothetical protein
MTTIVGVRIARPSSSKAVLSIAPAVLERGLTTGLKAGTPWQHLVTLHRYRRQRHVANRTRSIAITLSGEAEKAWFEKIRQIKTLKSKAIPLRNAQIYKRLPVVALARAVSNTYNVEVGDLISDGHLSPLALEMLANPQTPSSSGDNVPMAFKKEINPSEGDDEFEFLSPEETRAQFRYLSPPLTKPPLSMTDEEARGRLEGFMASLRELRAKLG